MEGIVDPADRQLMIQLQLEDLESLVSNHKGKGRASDVADDLLAFEFLRLELGREQQLLLDIQFSASFASAVETDSELIAQLVAEEEQALVDHQLAVAAAAHGGETLPDENTSRAGPINDPLARPIPAHAGPSNAPAATAAPKFTETTCTICLEDRFCQPMPCGHPFCHICLKQLFLNATKDEQQFPPSCCKSPIPVFQVRPFLSKAESTKYDDAAAQFSSVERIFCYVSTCSAFIPTPKNQTAALSDKRTCVKCGTSTCKMCKKRWHDGRDCPEDKELDETLRMAAKEGWQRCKRCYALVEKEYGCQHMSELWCELGFLIVAHGYYSLSMQCAVVLQMRQKMADVPVWEFLG